MVFDGTASGNANRLKGYLNGVEQTLEYSGTIPAAAHSQSAIFRIGKDQANNLFSQGSIDEVSVFSSALTAREVDALYNNGKPTKIRTTPNLAHWFRMGEGKLDGKSDGDENLLFDQGPNGGLGSELVTNGDFSDNSVPDTYDGSSAVNLVGWTSGGATFTADAHFVITDGKCRLISDGTNTVINSGTTVAGRTYRYSIDLTDVTSGGLTLIGGGVVLEANATSPRTYTGFYTATSATSAISINRQSGVTDFTFDNVSVKEVQNVGTINGPRIQADGGTELVTNGTFDADSDWSHSGTTISGGTANFSVSSGGYIFMNQSESFVDGSTYQLTATVNGTASKEMRFMDSGANNGGLTTSNGVVAMTGSAQEVSITFTANANSSTA